MLIPCSHPLFFGPRTCFNFHVLYNFSTRPPATWTFSGRRRIVPALTCALLGSTWCPWAMQERGSCKCQFPMRDKVCGHLSLADREYVGGACPMNIVFSWEVPHPCTSVIELPRIVECDHKLDSTLQFHSKIIHTILSFLALAISAGNCGAPIFRRSFYTRRNERSVREEEVAVGRTHVQRLLIGFFWGEIGWQ